jgi:hypothetical protein
MANCPNCGSGHLQMIRETNVSWGRAVAGWALFGVVGGAVGAVTGEERYVNSCLYCGTTWKATELYKTIQLIKKLTGVFLDLAIDNNRLFMNEVIPEITLYLSSIFVIDNEIAKRKANTAALGYRIGWACGISFSFIISVSTIIFGGSFKEAIIYFFSCSIILGLICSILGNLIATLFFEKAIKKIQKKIEQEGQEKKDRLERSFKSKIKSLKFNILNLDK